MSSSRPPSDMAPWHPRHRSLLDERQALLRLPQDRHPTWHPGIRAIAACSTSGRLSFVCLKTGRFSIHSARPYSPVVLIVLPFAAPLLQLLRAAAFLGASFLRPLVDSEPIN